MQNRRDIDVGAAIRGHLGNISFRSGFGTGSAGAGSVLAPAGEIFKSFYAAVKGNLFAFKNAVPMPTVNGAPMTVPAGDDTGATAEILPDSSPGTPDSSTPFLTTSFGSFCYSSGIFAVSQELLMDSAINPEEIVSSLGATRIARLLDNHMIVGSGVGQPQGLMLAATLGKTGANGQTTSVISQDFLDLLTSMDEGYWGDRMMFVMNRATFGAACKLGNPAAANAPLVQFDSLGIPRILGARVGIDSAMPNMAASAKSIALVNWDYVQLRAVEDSFATLVMVEKYAVYGQVGFIVRGRFDSKLLIPGAAKYYANSAT